MEKIGLTDSDFVHTVIRKRPGWVHKGDCGRILLAVGSRDMAGAAVLAARAAIKSGSGLVKVCTDRRVFPVLQTAVTEATCTRWEQIKGDLSFDAIGIGPGMGVGRKTENMLQRVLTAYEGVVVIDADGLNTIARSVALQRLTARTRATVIMTPHMGEAKRLLADDWPVCRNRRSFDAADKMAIGRALIRRYGCIAVVKGPGTLVAVSPEEAYTNVTGNPGMATAGSGDVLTGIITALAGSGLRAADAARAGVFVHGLSGDLAAAQTGEYGLTAGDIAAAVPFAFRELLER